MEQKRITFKVAKAIKEAGYPFVNGVSIILEHCKEDTNKWDFWSGIVDTTYLDVWLWLWTEKGIRLQPDSDRKEIVDIYMDNTFFYTLRKENKTVSPEEAIIAAIEYLVDNNLIK